MKKIDAVPVLRQHGEKSESSRARAAKHTEFFTFQVRQNFNGRILPYEDHVYWRENAVDNDDVFAFAARRRHGCKSAEADVDFSFSDHQVQIRGAQRFHFIRFEPNLIQKTMAFHNEIDEFLRARSDSELEGPGACTIGSRGPRTSCEKQQEQACAG